MRPLHRHSRSLAVTVVAAFLIFSASWVWHQQRAAAADWGPRSGSGASIRARVIREQYFNQPTEYAAVGLSLPIRDGEYDRVATYTSPVLNAEYAFNGVALDWIVDEPDATSTRIVLRVRDRGTWTDWFPVEASDDIQKPLTGDARQYMDPWFVSAADALQYRIVQRTGQQRVTPRLAELRITYLDSTRGPASPSQKLSWWQKALRPATAASAAGVPVISRADWGADESLRYTGDGEERWPRAYADVEKFIIHHTAGSDGGDDPAATIRGIYYFHAVTRGWGDIGYNYLVDPDGRIYAGRAGGAGVIGAHTYNEQTDTDFNRGSVGISVLGNYETTGILSDAAQDAIESLIATKAIDAGITPNGESTFRDQLLPNVIAHRDVDATACPGRDIYGRVDDIREGAQGKFQDAGGLAGLRRSVAVIDVTPSSLTLAPSASAEVVIRYRNTGTVNLTQRGLRAIFLRTSTENPLDHPSWDSAQRVTDIDDAEVAPGETGSVTFTIRAPHNALRATGRFRLAYRDDGGVHFISGSAITIRVQIEGYRYAGQRHSLELPSPTTGERVDWVTVRFTNRGTEPWMQDELRLWVYDLDHNPSVYRYHRWTHPAGRIRMVQQRVNPGGVATFRYRQQSPATPGRYRQEFLLRHGDAIVVGSGFARTTAVTSGLRGQLLSIQTPPVVRRVWRFPVVLELKNRGTMAWDRDVALVVTAPNGGTSLFWDASWEGTEVAGPVTSGTVVQRGVTIVTVWFEAPRTTGVIGSRIRLLERSSGQWVDGIDVLINVRVDP